MSDESERWTFARMMWHEVPDEKKKELKSE
ncbi:hypothetical protein HfxHF1_325 [Halophage HF1]|uniref:Uncharacterized protein n=2 Tax=Haloferacalesvirus TaxID=2843389 RepID=Q8V6Q8_9CAUD|nr:hypothetical protein HrrHF2_325 [Halorubrum phage HF2]NP_861633.1 hypothetical protein HfxHF1_325 [Halophage HF1]AAL54967.1 hypothetical protein HrrHF2_325 [Halorubrum phage HF2]AAO61344.1 hypothetical protein HfxHF1_325 [Halophage HF1]QIR31106.1 hypothetical protein HrrHc2_335 [Halorubrum virus Hardycor2]